jgi:hypothetical protein
VAKGVKEKSGTAEERSLHRLVIMAAMVLYFVTMDIKSADPQLPVGQLATIVRNTILPSVEALIPLRAQGRLVTGGT